MCEKFHNYQLRNDRALGNGKSDNYKEKKNVRSAWRLVSGSKSEGLGTVRLRVVYVTYTFEWPT